MTHSVSHPSTTIRVLHRRNPSNRVAVVTTPALTDSTPIIGVKAECTCPACDGQLRMVNKGCAGTYEAKCVVACTVCRREWLLTITFTTSRAGSRR
jgi:hypothetical protein